MIFKFSLQHESFGTVEISEPLGWETAKLKLTREPDYHSLVEEFDISATFYGDNGIHDGGISIIKQVELSYGLDTELRLIIEMSFDDGITYPLSFTGLLALDEAEWNSINQVTIPVIPDDIWTKFFIRKDTPVNIQSYTSLDDEPIDFIDGINVRLTNQKIRQLYNGKNTYNHLYGNFPGAILYGIIDFENETLSEINEKFNYPIVTSETRPFELFSMEYNGDYEFNSLITLSDIVQGTNMGFPSITPFTTIGKLKIKIQVNDDTAIEFSESNRTIPEAGLISGIWYHGGEVTDYIYGDTLNLNKGDFVRIYIEQVGAISGSNVLLAGEQGNETNGLMDWGESFLEVTSNTSYPDSNSFGFLIHDVAGQILDRIISQNNIFYSDRLGSSQTKYRQYNSDGCAWNYGLLKGLQIRQYSLLEKPFFLSFNQWWNGTNPIFNLGLGLETVTYESFNTLSIPALSTWLTTVGPEYEWTTGIANPIVNIPGGGGLNIEFSEILYSNFAFVASTEYTIEIDYNVVYNSQTSTSNNINLTIYDNSFVSQFQNIGTLPSSGSASISITFVATASCTRIGISASSGRNIDVSITAASGTSISQETEDFLRIEEKAHFYDQSGVSVYFDNVQEITRSYDQDAIINKVTVGYKKWQSENISGIDDPQTKHEYATRFKLVGKGFDITSDFIAASLAIETTRRTTREKSADYKFDNDTFIIALNPDQISVSPDTSPEVEDYIPELDENFNSIDNLLNAETRYNLILTPMRNLLRWSNVIMGALQQYLDSSFKFVSGEGNYDMISDYSCTLGQQCVGIICDPISESQDIPFTNPSYHLNFGYLYLHYQYDLTVDMSYEQYKAIRDNRNLAIGISQTDSNHVKFFIKTLEYEIKKGEAKITAWPVSYMDLEIIEQEFTMRCDPSDEDCENAITDELGLELTDELGICITFV